MSEQSVVILCRRNSSFGKLVVESALEQGLNLIGVIVQDWGPRQKSRRFRSYVKKYGLLTVTFSMLIQYLDVKLLAKQESGRLLVTELSLANLGLKTYQVPTLNGEATLTCLDRLSPDLILLAGVSIISSEIIERANLGVLNAHPGIVPDYRGNYVVRWALLAGDPIGITVHLVDNGVDTGPVISASRLALPRTRSLVAIEHYVDCKRAELLVSSARHFLSGEAKPVPQQSDSGSPLYSIMSFGKLLRTYLVLWRAATRKEVQTA
jgi:folate-dependent phosphoribosylglycinamide formyltransferase PurN